MNRPANFAILAAAMMGLYANPADAQNAVSFISGTGNDANPCSQIQPCRSFDGALGKTVTGGEIHCLDSAFYTGLTVITKSITFDCAGTSGILNTGSVDSITVGGTNVFVQLRN